MRGKCEDRDAEASKPRGCKESEGWRKPTFGSEICAPVRQVVDPFPGHAKPVFPAEVVVARRRNSDTSTTQYCGHVNWRAEERAGSVKCSRSPHRLRG